MEEDCRNYLFELRYPAGFECGRCGGSRHWKQTRNRITCSQCLYETSPLTGTIFHKSRLPLMLWFRAAWWVVSQKTGVNAVGLQKVLGLGSYRTAWLLFHKLRLAMVRPNRERLKGQVEADEIYIWRRELPHFKGMRRFDHCVIFVGAEKRKRAIGRIRMKLIRMNTKDELLEAIKETIEPGSLIETDGWAAYLNVVKYGYRHRRAPPTSDPDKILPRVHRIAALFKRWFLGTFHGNAEIKLFQGYIDEFVFRFNRRTSRSRGLLFYRLLENTVKVRGKSYKEFAKRKK